MRAQSWKKKTKRTLQVVCMYNNNYVQFCAESVDCDCIGNGWGIGKGKKGRSKGRGKKTKAKQRGVTNTVVEQDDWGC